MIETEVLKALFLADEVVGDAEVDAKVNASEVCCPDSDEEGAVAIDVSTKVETPSDGEKELICWLKIGETEFARLGAEVAMLGESSVAGAVVTENAEILANGPSPSGITYGWDTLLPSTCISPPGPSVRIAPLPETADPC
jgi:hypothetical protein